MHYLLHPLNTGHSAFLFLRSTRSPNVDEESEAGHMAVLQARNL